MSAVAAIQLGCMIGISTALRPLRMLSIRSLNDEGKDASSTLRDLLTLLDGSPKDRIPSDAGRLSRIRALYSGNIVCLTKYMSQRAIVSLLQSITLDMITFSPNSMNELSFIAKIILALSASEAGARLLVYPLDTMDKRMCVRRRSELPLGSRYWASMCDMSEGSHQSTLGSLGSLYAGAWLCIPCAFAMITTHSLVDSLFGSMLSQRPLVKLALTAAATELVCYPMAAVQTRMQVDASHANAWKCATHMWNENGTRAFYTGISYGVVHEALHWPLMAAALMSLTSAAAF